MNTALNILWNIIPYTIAFLWYSKEYHSVGKKNSSTIVHVQKHDTIIQKKVVLILPWIMTMVLPLKNKLGTCLICYIVTTE